MLGDKKSLHSDGMGICLMEVFLGGGGGGEVGIFICKLVACREGMLGPHAEGGHRHEHISEKSIVMLYSKDIIDYCT